MVHGDDFVGVGNPVELGRIRAALEDKYKLKVETLSGDKADVQEVKILNKIIRWTDRGIELEADPQHAEIVVRELGLEGICAGHRQPVHFPQRPARLYDHGPRRRLCWGWQPR